MLTAEMTPEMAELKTRLKATWEAGNYATFAKYLEADAVKFFDNLDLPKDAKILDVACGAGQITIPAAKRGYDITGIDLAQNLVDHAKERARDEALNIEIRQGDAESLPFEDASFDVVFSLIGAMFAPRPELVASEMARVCRPGGQVVMGNWTPEGFIGKMFKVIGKHVPPPAIFPSPVLWGNEETVRQRFEGKLENLEISRQNYRFNYPFGPAEVVDFFIAYYGPTKKAHEKLVGEDRDALRQDLIDLWTEYNEATDGSTTLLGEYLLVRGTRI